MDAFREMERVPLDPPPRRVPGRLAFRLLFGSRSSLAAACVLCLLGLALAPVMRHERRVQRFEGPVERAEAHVYNVDYRSPTNLIEYEFTTADGKRHVGSREDAETTFAVDNYFPLVMPVGHPELACRPEDRPAHVLYFFLVLPAAVLARLLWIAWRARRTVRLLVHGRLSEVELLSRAPPRPRSLAHTLVFGAGEPPEWFVRVEVRTHQPGTILRGPLVAVSDPGPPRRDLLLAALPGAPRLGDDGVLRDRLDTLDVLLSLVFPIVALGGAVAAFAHASLA
jgi:hypothetical protein